MGFCFFDNVAIAARTCQADYGDKCRKILIIDWDVHHGNGIQKAFEWDPNVLYVSIHVFRDEGGLFYPGSEYGNHKHCGLGKGVGFNINIPWPSKGMGDADYLYAFQQVIMPVAFEFNPDLVIIAAGFDAAQGDMLGGCFVSPAGYAHMTHMLMSLAEGRLAVCLEGGYNLAAIANSALAVTRVLMGEPPDRLEETRPTNAGLQTVQMVAMYQSRYWRCLEPKDLTKGETHPVMLLLYMMLKRWQKSLIVSAVNAFMVGHQSIRRFEHKTDLFRCYSLLSSRQDVRQAQNVSATPFQRRFVEVFRKSDSCYVCIQDRIDTLARILIVL